MSTRRPSSQATRWSWASTGSPRRTPASRRSSRSTRPFRKDQIERLRAFKASRDQVGVEAAIDDVTGRRPRHKNLLVPMREALKRHATLGEVSDALREVFGEYRPNR